MKCRTLRSKRLTIICGVLTDNTSIAYNTMVTLNAQELSADEIQLINHVRELKNSTGFGEVIATITDGKVRMIKQTKTVKL